MSFTIDHKKIILPTAWSPSALESYKECPRRYQYERQQKLCKKCFEGKCYRPRGSPDGSPSICSACGAAEVTPKPIAEGNVTHANAEKFIRGHIKKVGDDLANPKVKKLLAALRKGYADSKVRVELELAFTKDWKPTGWFEKDTWVRFKIDVVRLGAKAGAGVVEFFDWKTGKQNPDKDAAQMRSYATAGLLAGLGETVSPPEGVVSRPDLPKLLKEWEKKAAPLFVDKTFQPRPGYSCRYCPFSMNVGGPCPH
jgi:hypothetical protein